MRAAFQRYVFIILILVTSTAKSQVRIGEGGQVMVNKGRGQWTFIYYSENVVKAIFQPIGYTTNELITDAVIEKPSNANPVIINDANNSASFAWNDFKIFSGGDSFYIGADSTLSIAGFFEDSVYRGFRFILKGDEKIFGGGERALPLNRRGFKFDLYSKPAYGYGVGEANLNYSVPFITSSNHYGLFFDNPSKGYLDIGKSNPDILEYGAVSGELNFYIILGKSYPEILSSYYKLTGTQPLPPRWAMGNLLSRFGYTSQSETDSIMKMMRTYDIPYDAVIFDLYWFGDSVKETMGNLDWVNKKMWPDPDKMIAKYNKENTKTILITEPFVLKSSSNYSSSAKFHAVDSAGNPYVMTKFYFGNGGLIDIFRNDAKDWFWSKYEMQMSKGVGGWWGDLGEPETHPSNMYHNLKDLGYTRLFGADEIHNIYGHYWTKMLFDEYALHYPNQRLFSLNRSGFAGTQRYGIFPWTGDVSRTWSGLQAQLPVLLGMSMSGIPYVHSDAGGFAGGEKDPELYIRWLQFAAYTPVFRPHGTVDGKTGIYPTEAALFDVPYRELAKKIIQNRYSLLPYNYTLCFNQATEGKPLISPLYYQFEKDTSVYNYEDEFMWGENILVAPVLEKGITSRKIYLPEGKWYDESDHKMYEGNSLMNYAVDSFKFPVFIREGSFIPFLQGLTKTTQYDDVPFLVSYYPSSNSSTYMCFLDDGESKNSIADNDFALVNFSGEDKDGALTIRVSHEGAKKFWRRTINFSIPLSALPNEVRVNQQVKKVKIVTGKKSSGRSSRKVLWTGDKHTLLIPLAISDDGTAQITIRK